MQIDKLDRNMSVNTGAKDSQILWHDITQETDPCFSPDQNPFSLHGFAFYTADRRFCRLPQSIEPLLMQQRPQLASLMRHTAGGMIRFRTDSLKIHIQAELQSSAYMSHMTPAGQCGFDCYLRAPGQHQWFLAGITKFPIHDKAYHCCVFSQPEKRLWEVMIYFPLYIGVDEVKIGLDSDAVIERCNGFLRKGSIGFYGTSITQGGCASRPGMAYPAILGRMLDCEVYNFGFSGNGMADPCLAPVLASIPGLKLLVVDVEDNAGPNGVLEQNLPVFLDAVRNVSADLNVLVMSGVRPCREYWDNAYAEKKRFWHEFQLNEVLRRREQGDNRISFLDGLQDAGDDTIDGIHLTDPGFQKVAEALYPVIQKTLAVF